MYPGQVSGCYLTDAVIHLYDELHILEWVSVWCLEAWPCVPRGGLHLEYLLRSRKWAWPFTPRGGKKQQYGLSD